MIVRTLLLVLLGMTGLRAEDNTPPAVTDPVKVAQHYREVVARPEFLDTGEPIANTRFEDLLSQWFRNLGAKIGSFKYASQMPAVESLLMTLLVVLSISLLLYIMVRLTRRRGIMERAPAEDAPDEKTFRAPEFYEEEITQAIRTGDWHTAWLASWRQFLSRLENRRLVEADRTRTNREYLHQLTGRPLPGHALPLLSTMVDTYDRFIYGRKTIGEAEWNRFHAQIDEASLLLHLDDRKTSGVHVS